MHSKVRIIGSLAVALALGAGAAQAGLRPTHHPQPAAVPAPAGLVDAARVWLALWFPGVGSGRLSTTTGRDGTFIDPNGFFGNVLKPILPPTCPATGGGSTPTS